MIDTGIRTKWNQVQSKAQHRWSKLTTEDLVQVRGDVDRLVSLVQKRYGYTSERARSEVERFLDDYDHKVHQFAHTLPGNVDQKLMRRPWASLATAFVIGLATGVFAGAGRRGQRAVLIGEDPEHAGEKLIPDRGYHFASDKAEREGDHHLEEVSVR